MPEWLEKIIAWVLDLEWWEVVAIYAVAAFLVQFIIARFILALTRKTKTSVDDEAVGAIRWPLFLTVLFIGIKETMEAGGVSPETVRVSARILATLAAVIWMRGLMKVGDAVLDAMARRADDFKWINAR